MNIGKNPAFMLGTAESLGCSTWKRKVVHHHHLVGIHYWHAMTACHHPTFLDGAKAGYRGLLADTDVGMGV